MGRPFWTALVLGLAVTGCAGPPPDPIANVKVTLDRSEVVLGSVVGMAYQFSILNGQSSLAEDYRVFVHFVDGDGEVDAIIGDSNGYLHYFTGEGNFQFNNIGLVDNVDLSGNSDPILIDNDADGSLELLVGELNGNVNYYEYEDGQFNFIHATYLSSLEILYTSLDHFDIDNDGDSEIIIGSWGNGISIFDSQNGAWSLIDMNIPFTTLRSSPAITDINNDGVLDLFVGNPSGGLYYLEEVSNSLCNLGDFNEDDVFNILDIVQIVNIILYQPFPDTTTLCGADVNEDGIVDILDIVLLVNWIMEL